MNLHVPHPKADTPAKQLAVLLLKGLVLVVIVGLVAASVEQQRQQSELRKAQTAAHRSQVAAHRAQQSSDKAQAALAKGQLAIAGIVHGLCVNQNHAFSAVDSVLDHGISVTRQRLAADLAAGRTRNVEIDKRSIASSKVLRARIATITC